MSFELSFEDFHANKDRIYRVQQDRYDKGKLSTQWAAGAYGVGNAFKDAIPEIEDYVKVLGRGELLTSVERALEHARDSSKRSAARDVAANHLANLTRRQRQIMHLVLAGHPSKNIAADLGISQRTVEAHRAEIMKRLGAHSLAALARIVLAAESGKA